MRIAVVLGCFPILSETFLRNRIHGLLELGHEVDIYSHTHGDDRVFEYGAATLSLKKRITFFSSRRFRLLALAARAGVIDKRRYAYDVVYACFGINGLRVLEMRDRTGLLSGKLAVSFHGFDLGEFPRRKGESVYRDLLSRGDLFLPVCDFLANRLTALGCEPSRLAVVPTGIDCERFSRKEGKRRNGPLRLLSLGRLAEKKGLAYALQALSLGAKDLPEFEYHIVGDGPLRAGLEQLSKSLNLAERVHFHGATANERVAAWMNRCDVLIAPSVVGSQGDVEGIPNVIKEAMACEMVVVTTCHAGIPELVRDGANGYLVPEGDAAALSSTLIKTLNERSRWRKLGREARRTVLERFETKQANAELARLFMSLA